jgi:hypothetical protein
MPLGATHIMLSFWPETKLPGASIVRSPSPDAHTVARPTVVGEVSSAILASGQQHLHGQSTQRLTRLSAMRYRCCPDEVSSARQ